MDRPTCLHCGKTLRPYRWRELDWAIERAFRWGDYGDGRFCGLNCGYRFALNHTKLVRTPDPDPPPTRKRRRVAHVEPAP